MTAAHPFEYYEAERMKLLREVLGDDEQIQSFQRKKERMAAQFIDPNDLAHGGTTMTRALHCIISTATPHALILAAMMDKLSYVEQEYHNSMAQLPYPENIPYFNKSILEVSCAGGSRRVCEWMMDQLKIDFTTDGWEYLLGFVAASEDAEWAKSIASRLSSANKPCPNTIYDRAVSSNMKTVIRNEFPCKGLGPYKPLIVIE